MYHIQNKCNVFDNFKKWKALFENETRNKLRCLRSENGGGYYNKEFDIYYSKHGIHRDKTVLGLPQENGVSERMNMTIMEHESCMRLHDGSSLQFWKHVKDVVLYLINR